MSPLLLLIFIYSYLSLLLLPWIIRQHYTLLTLPIPKTCSLISTFNAVISQIFNFQSPWATCQKTHCGAARNGFDSLQSFVITASERPELLRVKKQSKTSKWDLPKPWDLALFWGKKIKGRRGKALPQKDLRRNHDRCNKYVYFGDKEQAFGVIFRQFYGAVIYALPLSLLRPLLSVGATTI